MATDEKTVKRTYADEMKERLRREQMAFIFDPMGAKALAEASSRQKLETPVLDTSEGPNPF